MIKYPLVSILMTAYNREKYIAEAIESVLASSYTNFELIIVDDCSEDTTVEIANAYAKTDNRIKVYLNVKNLGDYPNRNRAASFALGKYLKYLDSDDIIYPWGLSAMVYCMEQFPDAGYGLISNVVKLNKKYPKLMAPDQAYYAFYFEGSILSMGPSGAIINRAVFEKELGFSGKPYVGDTELWLKLSKTYSMVQIPSDLIWWREHENQQIRNEFANKNFEFNRYVVELNALQDQLCPFNDFYKEKALRNFKNRHTRNLGILLLKGKLFKFFNSYSTFKLKPLDFFKGLFFNTYPPPL